MREFKEKRRIRRFLFGRVTIFVLALLFLLIASATWSVFGKYKETRTNRSNAETNLLELENRASNLEEEIAELETPRGVEEQIRQNFGFVKEGERMIVIVEPSVPERDSQGVNTGGVWSTLLNLFR